jgi:DNA-binding response OmpR family regulator
MIAPSFDHISTLQRHVLLVANDGALTQYVARLLRSAGHAVDIASSAAEGASLVRARTYDAMVLDVDMPQSEPQRARDGVVVLDVLDVLEALRADRCDVPVIVLSGPDADVVRSLDAGADDAVRKPVSGVVLLARLRAVMRRARTAAAQARLAHGDVVMHRMTRRVVVGAREIALTPTEFTLLEYLLTAVDRVVGRDELLERVWRASAGPISNLVDVHVGRLRAKLAAATERTRIVTVRGVGYRMVTDDGPADEAPKVREHLVGQILGAIDRGAWPDDEAKRSA